MHDDDDDDDDDGDDDDDDDGISIGVFLLRKSIDSCSDFVVIRIGNFENFFSQYLRCACEKLTLSTTSENPVWSFEIFYRFDCS